MSLYLIVDGRHLLDARTQQDHRQQPVLPLQDHKAIR